MLTLWKRRDGVHVRTNTGYGVRKGWHRVRLAEDQLGGRRLLLVRRKITKAWQKPGWTVAKQGSAGALKKTRGRKFQGGIRKQHGQMMQTKPVP